MKKILIDNCVPLNNGDAALIFSIENHVDNEVEISYATTHYEKVKEIYPTKKWERSLLDYKIFQKIFGKSPFLGKIIAFLFVVVLSNYYKKNDIVISAPGGYIHSYYGIESKMYLLYLCKKYLNKKVGIYSQSVGNLSEKDQKLFHKYGEELDFIYVRDDLSYARATSYGLNNITQTKDAAFMFKEIEVKGKTKKSKKIAISMRGWTNEDRDENIYFDLMNKIVKILSEKGYIIEFISTCQGLNGYVDDSKTVERFFAQKSLEEGSRLRIDREYRNVYQLQEKISEFDYVIGTRLHMCILSLINNVPALNISYEEKGIEAYNYLGLQEFTIDYNEKSFSQEKIEKFLNLDDRFLESLWNRVQKIKDEQIKFLNKVL